MEKEYLSTSEVAKILRITRQAVLKKIQNGELKAQKIGRNYAIRKVDLQMVHGGELTTEKKGIINEAIKKTVQDYGEALKLLGRE